MKQDGVKSQQSDRESSVETEVILWPQNVQEFHSRFVHWAQSFQSNRLEHVLPWQYGVLGLFSGRRHLSCGAI